MPYYEAASEIARGRREGLYGSLRLRLVMVIQSCIFLPGRLVFDIATIRLMYRTFRKIFDTGPTKHMTSR